MCYLANSLHSLEVGAQATTEPQEPTQNKSCQSPLISSSHGVAGLVDQGDVNDVVFLDFGQAADNVSCDFLVDSHWKIVRARHAFIQ